MLSEHKHTDACLEYAAKTGHAFCIAECAESRKAMRPETGMVLNGFCLGIFGRNVPWNEKRVEAVGIDWIVVRASDSSVWFASFESPQARDAMIWKILFETRISGGETE